MVGLGGGKFRVELLMPTGKLLECRCGSLVLPGHDGQFGIMRNHCAMMCALGTGLMEVKEIPDDSDKYYVLDGGFVTVAENSVTVLSYDIITFEGLDKEGQLEMLRKAQEVHTGREYILTQKGGGDIRRARLVVRMAELAEIHH